MGLLDGMSPSREILRATEDGLQSIQIEHRMGRSLNDFFNGRTGDYERIDVDAWWLEAGLTVPGTSYAAIYSRKVFQYPLLEFFGKLLPIVATTNAWVGLETGGQAVGGIVSLNTIAGGAWKFGGGSKSAVAYVEVTPNLLPANYATGNHSYAIKLNKCNAELWVDGTIIAVVLFGCVEIPAWSNVPYGIEGTRGYVATTLSTLFELSDGDSGGLVWPIDATQNHFVAADGNPMPPRLFWVYNENTAVRWQGLATGGILQTSHPVPVWGYDNATFYFMASAAGTLTVEGYIGGGWRTIATPVVAPATLVIYNLVDATGRKYEMPLVRCTYDPTNNDTITLAEWCLS